MSRKLFFVFIFLLLNVSYKLALAKEYLPTGCQALALQGMNIESQASTEKLYFFHNISGKEIWLANRQSPKLTVGMQPEAWNILYVPEQALSFRCIQVETGHEQQVACQEVMALCEWSVRPPESLKTKNASWLVENQSILVSKAYLQRMGWLFDKLGTKLSKQHKPS
jgi:hypothetical protein